MNLIFFSFYFITIVTREFHSNIVNAEHNYEIIIEEISKPDAGVRRTGHAKCPAGQARTRGMCIDPGFFHGMGKRSTRYINVTFDRDVNPELRSDPDIIDTCDEPPKVIAITQATTSTTTTSTTLWPPFVWTPINRTYNPESYMYMMPKTMTYGDSIAIIATLKKKATRFQIFLINQGWLGLDYANMPLDFNVEIGAGKTNENVSLGYHYGAISYPVAHETNMRKHIFDERLIVMLSFKRHDEPEHYYRIDVYLNGKLLNGVPFQGRLEEMGFLHVTGDIERVDRLDFRMVQHPHYITM